MQGMEEVNLFIYLFIYLFFTYFSIYLFICNLLYRGTDYP